jgi:hypothetical protein
MPTLADLFTTCYLTGGNGVEFSAIRLHCRGVDEICRAFGATALTVGSDIYFRQEAFAPHTPEGGAPGRAVRPARAARPGPASRRRGTAAGRAPRRPDAAPARQRSLVVAAGPDGAPFPIHGDRMLLAGGDGALHAARATAASRRAVAELLAHGETGITGQEIFESLPDHVEQEGTLVALRQWHDSSLRDLCFGELFSLWRTSATRILASAVCRRFGVPSPDIEALRNG